MRHFDQIRAISLSVERLYHRFTPFDSDYRLGPSSQAQNRGFAENADQVLNNPRLLLIRGSPGQLSRLIPYATSFYTLQGTSPNIRS
jgi:hypothetical protein